MIPLSVGCLRNDAPPTADPTASPRLASSNGERVVADGRLDAELASVLQPMLEAIVRLAGADAGTVKVIGRNGASSIRPSPSGSRGSHGRAPSWCTTCAESRNADSQCVRSDLCGHDERIPADALGPVCKHLVAVPLRHRDRPVGTLNLMFDAECALPPAMTPLLRPPAT